MAFLFVSERNLDGKSAAKEVSVRPIHVLWRRWRQNRIHHRVMKKRFYRNYPDVWLPGLPGWWSRGESNPCPKIYSHIFLRVHSVYCVSEQRCRQTGCAIRIALSHDCYKRQFTVHVHRLFDTSAEVAVVLGEMRCNLGSECYVFVSV